MASCGGGGEGGMACCSLGSANTAATTGVTPRPLGDICTNGGVLQLAHTRVSKRFCAMCMHVWLFCSPKGLCGEAHPPLKDRNHA